jgi:hypothetical protein
LLAASLAISHKAHIVGAARKGPDFAFVSRGFQRRAKRAHNNERDNSGHNSSISSDCGNNNATSTIKMGAAHQDPAIRTQ